MPEPAPTDRAALDLGCGPGNETMLLLARGFRVTAVDAHGPSIDTVRQRAEAVGPGGPGERLTLVQARFESLDVPPASFDLIHAGFALPFCAPAAFDDLWGRLLAGLRPGGLIAAQLFGPEDDWVKRPGSRVLSSHDRTDLDRMLRGMDLLWFQEEAFDGSTATGEAKRARVIHEADRSAPASRWSDEIRIDDWTTRLSWRPHPARQALRVGFRARRWPICRYVEPRTNAHTGGSPAGRSASWMIRAGHLFHVLAARSTPHGG